MKNTKLAEHKKLIRKCKRILAFLLHVKQTAKTEGRLRDAYLSIVEVLEYIEAEEVEGAGDESNKCSERAQSSRNFRSLGLRL